jgi:aminocarboxymuconate-semialdehyde decarboxylase
MTIIDVHCHIVPADFPAAPPSCQRWPSLEPRGEGRAAVMIGGAEFRIIDNRCWDTARRIADMTKETVGMQVLSPMPELLSYWLEPKDTLALARHVNRAIAAMVTAHPDRFLGLGMVPLQDPEMAARELAALRTEHGLLGVEIGSSILGRPPGDPSFDIFFAEAERLDMAVFVHALHPATDRIVGPAGLAAFVAFPTDVGLAAASMISGGTLRKFPKLRVAFSHGGGTLAAFLPRMQMGWDRVAALNGAFASPTETARRFYYDNIVFDDRLLRTLIDLFGGTQIFAGSDYPFAAGRNYEVGLFAGLGLSPDELAAVLAGNARRFLNLPA